MIKNMDFAGSDERVKKYLLPKRVLSQWGQVSDADKLLEKKTIQIGTNESVFTVFENGDGEENAAILLDFGVEITGGAKLLTCFCEGEPYLELRLCFGESAAEAMSTLHNKNALNDHSTRDMTVRIPQLSDMEFGQTGYRFLKLELLSKNTKIRLKSIYGVFIYRELEYKGEFECDNDLINRIYDVSAYTCHLNMQSMLWDGVKRDRLVWIGDMHPEMLTIRSVFGYHKIVDEGLAFAIEQNPLPGYPNGMVTYAMWWLIILRDWYYYHGDKGLLGRYSQYVRELLPQLCTLVHEDGSDDLGQYDTGYFLDWQSFFKPQAVSGVRALFSLALDAGAELCAVLGYDNLKQNCREKSVCLKNKVTGPWDRKQVAAMMCLAGHVDAVKAARDVLLPGGAKGISTFMSYYILSALAAAGKTEQALSILSEYYGGMLAAGATTFWEDFDIDWLKPGAAIDKVLLPGEYDIHGDNGAHCYVGYRHSLCHGWSSGPVPFLAEKVLGVRILEPGCKRIAIIPDLGDLKWVKGSYPTPYGVMDIYHEKAKDGTIKSQFTAPNGIEVEVDTINK